jgi:TonB family protein
MIGRLLASSLLLICLASAAAAQVTSQPPQVSDGVMTGLLLHKVNPVYAPLARQARIQGTVVLRVAISKSGDVQSVQLISGHPMLAPAAVEAVKQWKYRPYLLNGDPVDVQTQVQVNFVLSEQHPLEIARDPASSPQAGASTSENVNLAGRVRVSENVMRSLRIQEIDATYPALALQAKVEGLVVMKVFISKSGEVENVDLISGHPLLAPPAIDAVKQWKYQPYLLNGEPVEVESLARVDFALSKEHEGQGSAIDAVLGDTPKEFVPAQPQAAEQDANQPKLPTRIRVSSGVESRLLIKKVDPEYPLEAKAQMIQGVVLMQATIDAEGNVADLQLISGHPVLAPAAIEAVKQWKYKPYLLNGKPLIVETKIQVNFTLE